MSIDARHPIDIPCESPLRRDEVIVPPVTETSDMFIVILRFGDHKQDAPKYMD